MVRNAVTYGLEKAGRRLAAHLTPPWRGKDRPLAALLRSLFARRRIDCVIDVGANRGQYYRFLRYQVGFRGPVASFEPIPELAADLADRARFESNWYVFPCALGAAPGSLRLNVMVRHSFSSVLAPDHSRTDTFATKNVVDRVIEVPVCTLDDAWADLRMARSVARPYLKLDTQGHDLEVLAGARAALADVHALQTELSFQPLYVGIPDWRRSIDTVAAAGFEVASLFPVTRDAEQRLIEADCVFVRGGREPPAAP
jgi:FkbM family methyltransferase